MATRALDIRGLICPITWARVRRELMSMSGGDRLEIVLDHRPAVSDIKRNAADLGHEVTTDSSSESEWRLIVEVGRPESGAIRH